MKTLSVILTVLFIFSINNFAQNKEGKITLSGGLNFNSYTEKTDPASNENTMSSFTLKPSFGYYISNTMKLGLGINYTSETDEMKPASGTAVTDKFSMFVINPYARFYTKASEKLDLFLQANVELGFGNYDNNNGANKGKLSSLNVYLTPGIEYMVSQRISFDVSVGSLGYFSSTREPDGSPTVKNLNSNFGLNFDLSSVAIGLNVIIN